MEVDRILSRNDVGDGGAGGGRFFGSWFGGGSFGRHGCCEFPGKSGSRCGGVEELIDIVVFNDSFSGLWFVSFKNLWRCCAELRLSRSQP